MVKRPIAAALALLPAAAAMAAPDAPTPEPGEYRNPILFADYSDPDAIRVGRSYYLVASSFHFSPGIPVLRSGDLVHWTIVAHVLPRLDFAPEYDLPGPVPFTDADLPPNRGGGGQRYGSGVWAPAIRHHAGRFYVYWPTPTEGIFMATAEKAEGPWSRPATVIAGPRYEDPCPFWDDDGKAYLVHSRTGAGPLILHRMAPDGRSVLDEGRVIVEDPEHLPNLEGPKFVKRDGWYCIFSPIAGVGAGTQAVLRSRSIYGPYEWRVVLERGATSVRGPHQGAYVETPSGEGWFVHFSSTGAFGRIVYLEPVRWAGGWPVIGEPIPGKESGQPVSVFRMPDVGGPRQPVRIQDSDEFSGPELGLQWEWNHNPDDACWSLAERPGFLRLKALPARDLVGARNTLTQILQGPDFEATARIDARGMADGQRAGLAMLCARPSWIGIARESGGLRAAFSQAGRERLGPPLPGPDVELRLVVAPDQTVRYAYRAGGRADFAPLGGAAPIRFSWWKGARPALFTYTRPGGGPGGSVDIDWFRVAHP